MTPLLLLHGAIGSASQLEPLARQLQTEFDVHAINFFGHGGANGNDRTFSIDAFARQAASYIQAANLTGINIFGYSMGGYVAMYMARHLGTNINKIITLGTKFYWDEEVAAKECKMLQPAVIEQKLPAFAQVLSERHGATEWKNLLNKTAEMLHQMGKVNPLQSNDYQQVQAPSLIMIGDRDKMVTRDETIHTFQSLPNAQLAILPGTPHPIEQADSSLVAFMVRRFLVNG